MFFELLSRRRPCKVCTQFTDKVYFQGTPALKTVQRVRADYGIVACSAAHARILIQADGGDPSKVRFEVEAPGEPIHKGNKVQVEFIGIPEHLVVFKTKETKPSFLFQLEECDAAELQQL